MNEKPLTTVPIPLVVQLGFAGSRHLIDADINSADLVHRFEEQIEQWLANRLAKLRSDLNLSNQHFFCGISSMAIGGDMIFSRACRAGKIPQRVFLPHTRGEFLSATGSQEPDFPRQSQKDEAIQLLDSPHVIQVRLVSDASIRKERFDDTNREIVRLSDVLICLLRKGSTGKTAGTQELIARAVQREKPVLVIDVDVAEGELVFTEQWRLPQRDGVQLSDPTKAFDPPKLPTTVANVTLSVPNTSIATPPIEQYVTAIKNVASPAAKEMQAKFKLLATIIVGTHIAATILAAGAMGFEELHKYIGWVLGLELIMLATGLFAHRKMHRSRVSHLWAEARLLAEVTRSVQAIGELHVYLSHLFSLPFPKAIRPVLRTINVLQLKGTRQNRTPWEHKRDIYIQRRLTLEKGGQLAHYAKGVNTSNKYLKWLGGGFYTFWTIAFCSTLLKLLLSRPAEGHHEPAQVVIGLLGTLAIVMPVVAAGALSLATALDLEARELTYEEMHKFLEQQERHLKTATSERDYAQLVLETESQLLGETANWFSRRSYVTVT